MKKTEIYLLEDMPDDVYIIRHMLGGENSPHYKIHNFPLLETLQKALEYSKPDILLIDLNLPGTAGLETLINVKRMAPDVPIIVLTNGDEETLGDRAIQLGAQDFIPKHELSTGLLKRALRFAKERHSMQRRLENLVSLDVQTLVYNRRDFDETFRTTIAQATRYKRKFGLLMIDIDGFKSINQQHGEKVGDQVLRHIGMRLKDVNRSSDYVARFGSDEFVVIVHGIQEPDCLTTIAKNHFDKIKGQYLLELAGEVKQVQLSLSVGGAIFPDHADDSEALVAKANEAMTEAQREGGGYCVLDE